MLDIKVGKIGTEEIEVITYKASFAATGLCVFKLWQVYIQN